MQKMTPSDGQSMNVVDENIEVLKKAFPEAFTEDGIDFEVLRQLLGDNVAEGEEKYGLNWFGKKKARSGFTSLDQSAAKLRWTVSLAMPPFWGKPEGVPPLA
jgi:hypothetical protein